MVFGRLENKEKGEEEEGERERERDSAFAFASASAWAMAASLFSLVFHSQASSFSPPTSVSRCSLPPLRQTITFTAKCSDGNRGETSKAATEIPPPPSDKKKSFAVATGELFLGIASRLLLRSNSNRNTFSKSNNDSKNNSNGNSSSAGNSSLLERLKLKSNYHYDYGKDRIRAVIEDEIEAAVIWEQRVKDVEAEKERYVVTSPGFSFSAAGLLFPYHLGVAQCLIEKGYIKETTPLAGSSAGAIVCAVIASGASMEEALKATKILADNCRLKGTAFRLGAVLRDVLENFLPGDIHIKSNGRVRVAVTQILWRPRGLLVDQYDSKEDLINAVITSSFIPGYLAPRPVTVFRNRLCIDGGLTLFMPPTSAAQTVRVCAFPATRLGLEGIGISPDCNPKNRATPRELFNWALEPAEDGVLDRLFELGYLDAAVWAEENPVEKVVQDDAPFVGNGNGAAK